ncbi:MAG: HEAT repeat domain-containing protein [Planctomycetes bacterium]|nr:HEAT repeat domain-containing protein [Planctomycetota bacterium]
MIRTHAAGLVLTLAGVVAAQAPSTDPAARRETPGMRARALLELAERGGEGAFERSCAALDDPVSVVREAACAALGILGDARAVPLLRERLAEGEDWIAAAQALGRLGDRPSFDVILARLWSGKESWFALRGAVEALCSLDRSCAIALLGSQLAAPDGPHGPGLGALLARVGPDGDLRRTATRLLQDQRLPVRIEAIAALGGAGDLGTVSMLMGRLGTAEPVAERIALVEALGALGHEFAVDPIAACLDTGDALLRMAAVEALERIGHPTAASALARLIDAEQDDLALLVRALVAVGRLGSEQGLAVVARRLDDERQQRQAPEFSRVFPFPMNTFVCDAAAWAALQLLDGTAPIERDALMAFGRDTPHFDAAQRAALRARIAGRLSR